MWSHLISKIDELRKKHLPEISYEMYPISFGVTKFSGPIPNRECNDDEVGNVNNGVDRWESLNRKYSCSLQSGTFMVPEMPNGEIRNLIR